MTNIQISQEIKLSTLGIIKHLQLENKCQKFLRDDTIRFIGVINNMGKLIAGGTNEEANWIKTDEQRRMLYIQMALEISMRKDFDDVFGKINYTATSRNKILMMIIPMNNHAILISAEPTTTAEQIIEKLCAQKFFQLES